MSNRQPTEESFLNDVSKHEMKVLLDNGIYRHLRFKQPNSSNMWFDVVTWPGFLAFAGDMGSFVFSRLEDMFEFFRSRPRDEREKLFINLGYWGEKLEAVDSCGRDSGYLIFSEEKVRKHVEDRIKDWVEEYPEDETELREAVKEEIYRFRDDGEHELRSALAGFDCTIHGHHYEFQDTWEWDLTDYTFRFVWCCYSLAWSIQQYDKFKERE